MLSESEWREISENLGTIEFDWFARDRTGSVAVFSSCAQGLIPMQAIASREAYNGLATLINSLPEISDARLVFRSTGRFDDWLTYSRKGLYGYDFQDIHRPSKLNQYDLLTVPNTPIRYFDLPLRETLLSVLPLVDVEFGRDDAISFAQVQAV